MFLQKGACTVPPLDTVSDWGGCLQETDSRSCAHTLAAGEAREGRVMVSLASGMEEKLYFVGW